MNPGTTIALALALASTTLVNLAYLREHDAAAALPAMSLRRPLHSLQLLLSDRAWLLGFAMETGGFALYVAALALAPLALVQSISAGGIGLLALASARLGGRHLTAAELRGALISVAGLLFLALSLIGGDDHSANGSTVAILSWLGASALLGAVVYVAGRRILGAAVADAIAGGLLFSLGDIATKITTQGGGRLVFALAMILGYVLGTSLLQVGYQRGEALTVAGIATLLTNALPIVAATVLLDESVPGGALGTLRVLAFATVVVGAILLAMAGRASQPPPADAADGRAP